MKRFDTHTGQLIPLNRLDIDTDIIIPKEFMKRVERTGYGQFLMYDWRYQNDGSPKEDFVFNKEKYKEANILLTQKNFGCGSSRENAVWALQDYGFKVIIAPSFADIFKNNCSKNGLLLIELEQEIIDELFAREKRYEKYLLSINLVNQQIEDTDGWGTHFHIDPLTKQRLLLGLDDIDLTLQSEQDIQKYERSRPFYFNPCL